MNISKKIINKELNWQGIITSALAFWISGSLLLDFVLIPSLSVGGMMNDGGFASVGYILFGIFNRLEIICASLVVTVALAYYFQRRFEQRKQIIFLLFANLLFFIALAYTYVFTPHLSAWGLSLNEFASAGEMPPAMISWHEGFWFLEGIKYLLMVNILRWSWE